MIAAIANNIAEISRRKNFLSLPIVIARVNRVIMTCLDSLSTDIMGSCN
jgi:hypothetical protein